MTPSDSWTSGDAYQRFMGRWSPFLANLFVPWLGVPAGREWLDVGCGTGALTRTILALASPARVLGVDPSETFVEFSRQNVSDPRAGADSGGSQSRVASEPHLRAKQSVVTGVYLPLRRRQHVEIGFSRQCALTPSKMKT